MWDLAAFFLAKVESEAWTDGMQQGKVASSRTHHLHTAFEHGVGRRTNDQCNERRNGERENE